VGTYSKIVNVSMEYNLMTLPMFLGFDKLLQRNLCSKDIDLAMFHTRRAHMSQICWTYFPNENL
jgi:hypothetical protein